METTDTTDIELKIVLTPEQILYLNNIAEDLQRVLDNITWATIYQWYPELIDKQPTFNTNTSSITYKNAIV